MLWLVRGSDKLRTKRSETKEAVEALSSSALTSTEEPSGATIETRHVMSNVLAPTLTAACELDTSAGSAAGLRTSVCKSA